MNLKIVRHRYTARETFGKLYIDDKFICYTLEDTLRPWGIKVHGETGIPAGEYNGRFRKSPSFNANLPILFTEEDRVSIKKTGIGFKYTLIHAGNYIEDTESCILVGLEEHDSYIGKSRKALEKLLKEMEGVKSFTVEIKNLAQNE